eukprot:m.18558 g.18558  ORF g.18558 m.18558 type:complete len:192 (+) comp10830_c0_seq1:85-660(+)
MLDVLLAGVILSLLILAAIVIAYVTYRIATYTSPAGNNNDPQAPPVIQGDDSTCAICLDPPTDAIITNCGHVYCAACILQAHAHSGPMSSLSCPTCRRNITLMMPRHAIQDAGLRDQVHSFNRRYGPSGGSLGQQLRDAPTLVRQLLSTLTDPRSVGMMVKVHVLLVAELDASMPEYSLLKRLLVIASECL